MICDRFDPLPSRAAADLARSTKTWRRTLALLLALLAFFSVASRVRARAVGDDLSGRVEHVFDGDSFVMRSGGRRVEVRVFGIDAPEKGQPWSRRSRDRSRSLLDGAEVVVRVRTKRDVHRRVVGEVVLPDGRDYARVLVGEGLAWHYRRYSDDAELAGLEAQARLRRIGLWTAKDPEPPWKYRRRNPRR